MMKQCYECKEMFDEKKLVAYAPATAKVKHNYCPDCLAARTARDAFSDTVCRIFQIKTPGPRIWRDRKRLMNTYGYTDKQLIECLEYIYDIKKMAKLSESLALITPAMMEETRSYRRMKEYDAYKAVSSIVILKTQEHYIPKVEDKEKKKNKLNPDDYLNDD